MGKGVYRCSAGKVALLATAALIGPVFGLNAHDLTAAIFDVLRPRAESRLIAAGTPLSALAPPLPEGTPLCRVTFRLLEAETNQPGSGLVRVRRADGTVLPLDGLVSHGVGLPANHRGREWHAVLEEGTVSLPREELRIEAIAGLETELASQTLDLRERETAAFDLPLTRFAEPGASGWRSGNTHLHLRNLSRDQAVEYLRTLPRAGGLEMLFVSHLRRAGADEGYITNQFTPEEIRALSDPKVTFGWGEEMRHNFGAGGEGYGHVMLLNLRQLVEPVSIGPGITGGGHDFPPLRTGLKRAREEGGSVLWCHNAFGFEDVPNWLVGLIHAQNIFDGGTTGSYADSHYRYLNLGLRVPFSTGTDWFLYDFARVYARLEGTLTEQNWLKALAEGRSYITNGPILEFGINGSGIGDTIEVNEGRDLTVAGRATGRVDFKAIELVHNGEVVVTVPSSAVDGHFEADLKHVLPAAEAGWLALRVPSRSDPASGGDPRNECGEPLFAHTSPIYLAKNGRLRQDPAAVKSLLADLARARTEIAEKGQFANEGQKAGVLRLYEEAEKTLRNFFEIQ